MLEKEKETRGAWSLLTSPHLRFHPACTGGTQVHRVQGVGGWVLGNLVPTAAPAQAFPEEAERAAQSRTPLAKQFLLLSK